MTIQRVLHFTKMHALSNDFMVVDGHLWRQFNLDEAWIRAMGDRHQGVGFDQLLVLEVADDDSVDFNLAIYNRDGRPAEQCGNGTLCVAFFAMSIGLVRTELEALSRRSRTMSFRTLGGTIAATVLEATSSAEATVRAELGVPSIEPACVPFCTDQPALTYELELGADYPKVQIIPVSMGNPHGVVFMESSFGEKFEQVAQAIQNHERFPASVNVEFVEVIDRQSMRLRVFERGVGETMACGTGACAAVTAARLVGRIDECVQVFQAGGSAEVSWCGPDEPITLTAVASRVFEGELDIG